MRKIQYAKNNIFKINKNGYISPKNANNEKFTGLIYADKYANIKNIAKIIFNQTDIFLKNLIKS